MGICTCRKSTGLFCFVHKKAVCTSCIVDHPVCPIRTYVEWLKDSEYQQPLCVACGSPAEQSDTIRLMCLHLYHRRCLEEHCASYPEHTALAGYACSACSKPVIPQMNDQSRLAASIRHLLADSPWAKRSGFAKPSSDTNQSNSTSSAISISSTSNPTSVNPSSVSMISASASMISAPQIRKGKEKEQPPEAEVAIDLPERGDPDVDRKYDRRRDNAFSGFQWPKKGVKRILLVALCMIILFAIFHLFYLARLLDQEDP